MIELWTYTGARHHQRFCGTLKVALEAAKKELEAGRPVQIIPGREEPAFRAEPLWDE